jgi:hypothetical protein
VWSVGCIFRLLESIERRAIVDTFWK